MNIYDNNKVSIEAEVIDKFETKININDENYFKYIYSMDLEK